MPLLLRSLLPSFPKSIFKYKEAISTHRIDPDRLLQLPILLIARIVIGVRGNGWQLLARSYLPQSDLPPQLMRMHDNGEYVDAAVRYRVPGAVRDAVTLGHHLRLAWRYDVPPVGVDADAQDAGVVGAQLVRVMQTQTGTVAYERVHLRIGVVGLEHVVARTGVRIQRVTGLGRVIEPLREEEAWRTALDYAPRWKRTIRDRPGLWTVVRVRVGYKWLFFTLFLVSADSLDELLSSKRNSFAARIFTAAVEDFSNGWRGTFESMISI